MSMDGSSPTSDSLILHDSTMETSPSPSPWWITLLQALAVPIAGVLSGLVVWAFKDWRKQKPEVRVLEATFDNLEAAAEKSRAEASRLYIETIRETNEQLNEMREIVIDQHNAIRDRDKAIQTLERDKDLWLIDRGLMESQMQHMHAVLKVRGITLSDYDHMLKRKGD